MEQLLINLVAEARVVARDGHLATYIPALAMADPNQVAICVATLDGQHTAAGDYQQPFTLQSVSKVFALLYALESLGSERVFQRIGCEPSGHPFYSLVQLEYEQGRPRNPLINAGAIAISALLPGHDIDRKISGYLDFLRYLTGDQFAIDHQIYQSESTTGYRNRAVADFMHSFKVLACEPQIAVETYFQQCSTLVTTNQLAQLGLVLANKGKHPISGASVTAEHVKIVNALMSSCGLYDEAGHFALTVGIPAKSGVSGGLLAIAPARYAIASFAPALNEKGNSLAGLFMLTALSNSLDLSVYL